MRAAIPTAKPTAISIAAKPTAIPIAAKSTAIPTAIPIAAKPAAIYAQWLLVIMAGMRAPIGAALPAEGRKGMAGNPFPSLHP